MEERFIKPLGLTETLNCMAAPVVPRRVHGYQPRGSGWANAPYLAMSHPYAAGALCSSVYGAWTGGIARCTRAAWSPQRCAPLMTSRRGRRGRTEVRLRPGPRHDGRARGDLAQRRDPRVQRRNVRCPRRSFHHRAHELGLGAVGYLLRQVARAALGAPLEVPPTVVPLTAADRARYAGVYALSLPAGARDFTVAEVGDGLTGQPAGQNPVPLLHYGNHTFGASFDPSLRVVFTIEGGRATRMTLVQGGQQIDGPRK